MTQNHKQTWMMEQRENKHCTIKGSPCNLSGVTASSEFSKY